MANVILVSEAHGKDNWPWMLFIYLLLQKLNFCLKALDYIGSLLYWEFSWDRYLERADGAKLHLDCGRKELLINTLAAYLPSNQL